MKKLVWVALVLGAAYLASETFGPGQEPGYSDARPGSEQPDGAHTAWRSGQQVRGSGTVTRVLADDNTGSRHQRFILRLDSGQTLLIAHNIDLAARIPSLRVGDRVSFYGVYEWNSKGGVIHWTHADPQGRHVAGWLEYKGRRYQ